jgi:hypothetical protein
MQNYERLAFVEKKLRNISGSLCGGPVEVANLILQKFGRELVGEVQTALKDLAANFESHSCQGALAFSQQILIDHPELDELTVRADAIVAVTMFYKALCL